MNQGDTFLITDGTDDHLWVIISDPALDPDNVVAVMLVSWQQQYDQACILYSGDHPFVKHPTCVQFPAAMVTTVSVLQQKISQNKVKVRASCSDELLLKSAWLWTPAISPISATTFYVARGLFRSLDTQFCPWANHSSRNCGCKTS